MEKDSKEHLQWELSRLKEKYDNLWKRCSQDSIHKKQKVHSLENEVLALQAMLKTAKERESGLVDKFKISQTDNAKHVQDIGLLRESIQNKGKISKNIEARLQQRLTKTKEHYEKALKKLKQEHEEMNAFRKANFDNRLAQNRKELNSLFKEQAQKHKCEVERIKKEYHEVEEEHKRVVENLENVLIEKEAELTKQEEKEDKRKDATRYEYLLQYKGFEMKIEALRKTITQLRNREDLTPTVSALENTVKQKNKIIGNKNVELAALHKEKKELQEGWCREKDTNAILLVSLNEMKDNNRCLKNEKRQEQLKVKKTTEELNKAKKENSKLTDIVTHLRYRVKTSEPDLLKLRAINRKLETCQLRFKEDLQTCMSVITEPQKLKDRILTLKRRYIDDDEQVGMDDNTERMYQHQVGFLKKQLDCSLRIQKNQSKLVKDVEEQFEKNMVLSYQNKSNLMKLFNKKCIEVHTLKQDLEETKLQLQMATESPQNAQAAVEAAEQQMI